MSQLKAASVIALFFALRCIVPLLITAAIAYLLNRLVDRWEAEAEAAASSPASIPVQGTVTTVNDGSPSKLPCWLLRNCDAEKRSKCPAYLEPSLPCWIARMLAEGTMPKDCPDCPAYDARLAIN